MSAICAESYRRRRLAQYTASREYIITGAVTDTEARDALLATAPTTVNSLARNSADAEVDEIEQGIFEGRVSWGLDVNGGNASETDDPKASFDIGGLSIHRQASIATVNSYYATGVTAFDFGGLINVSENGEVRGVELPAQGSMVYSKTHWKTTAEVTQTYIRNMMALYLTVCSGTFDGFVSGELLFLGASGQLVSPTLWEIQYQFGMSPNKTGLSVGGITGITKKGWDYLWAYYKPQVGGSSIVRRPTAVFVEQVFDYESWGALNA